MSKLSHLLEMIITLQYKPLTSASELAEILGVDKKTIYRYIDSLNEANIPVHTKKGRYGGFYLDDEFCMKPNNLSEEELKAIIMASEILTKENGFNYENELKNAVAKIKKVEINAKPELQHMVKDKGFKLDRIGCIENLDENIAKVNYAMQKGRTLSITYYSVNKNSTVVHKVDPYNLVFHKGDWCLIGYSYYLNCVETFKFSRIRRIKSTNEIYMKPVTFSLKEYLDKNKSKSNLDEIDIKIKFSSNSNVSDFIKDNIRYDNREIEENKDGNIVLKFSVADFEDVKEWIMGFGAEVEVVEPQSLRDQILNDIEMMLKIYKKS